jgi:SAM-dependent methyltransferase
MCCKNMNRSLRIGDRTNVGVHYSRLYEPVTPPQHLQQLMLQKTSKFSVFMGATLLPAATALADLPLVELPAPVVSPFGGDYEACHKVYNEIYQDIPCDASCKASLADRASMKVQKDYTLTYGELSTMEPMWRVLESLIIQSYIKLSNVQRFYDLGSGSGRPVISAAVILDHFATAAHCRKPDEGSIPATHCVGVELLPGLFNLSLAAKLAYESTAYYATQSRPAVSFYEGSIFDLAVCDWTDGDIVYVNSTCFDVKMMLQIYAIAERLRAGAIMITLSRSMIEIGALARNIKNQGASSQEEDPHWKLLFETREQMSW